MGSPLDTVWPARLTVDQTFTGANTFTQPITVAGGGTFGGVVRGDSVWDKSNVKWWGAKGDGITDDTVSVQAAFDSGIGEVYFPDGVYPLGSINLYNRQGLIIRGAGNRLTTLVPVRDDYPMLDCSLANDIHFLDFKVLSDRALPSCAILVGRVAGGDSSGSCTFVRLEVWGSYRVAAVYTLASECNSFYNCRFGYPTDIHSNAQAAFYCAKSATNVYWTPIKSLYASLTDDGSGGNSFNAFHDCLFEQGDGRADSTCLILEFGFSHTLDGCYFFSSGPTNQIVLQKNGVGLTMSGCRQETWTIHPTHGLFVSDTLRYRDWKISGCSLFPVGAVDSSIISNVDWSTTVFNGVTGVGTIGFDVDTLFDSHFSNSDVEPNTGSVVADARWRVRNNVSRGNTFVGVSEANLMGYATNSVQIRPDASVKIQNNQITTTLLHLIGGGVPATVSDLNTSCFRMDMANPAISLVPGFAANGSTYWQSFNNTINVPIPISLNPFGGFVGIGKTDPLTELDVAGQITSGDTFFGKNGLQVVGPTSFNISSPFLIIGSGGICTTLADMPTKSTFRLDLANTANSITFGYLSSTLACIQAVNNVISSALPMAVNPLGGYVAIGKTTAGNLLDVGGTGNFDGIVIAAQGVASLGNATIASLTSTGCTNNTTVNQVIYVSTATAASLTDHAGSVEFSNVTISTFTCIRIQPGGVFAGTGITYPDGLASHAW